MTARHLHLMGVGGVGMCGLAEVLLAQGLTVSGCDLADNERTRRLADLGAKIHLGHEPGHLEGVDALVVTAAVPKEHPELMAATERGLPVVRRAEMLAELMRFKRGVAVAGTHGKTTTTAIIGHILTSAGADPTVIVGGRAHFLGAHARVGGSQLLVEADEFDRSFLELAPQLAVITNLEPEHLDCYENVEDLRLAFTTFANRASVFGAAIVCADDPGAWSLRDDLRRKVVGYGFSEEAEMRLEITASEVHGTEFTVFREDRRLGDVSLPMPGNFNALNTLAAITAGLELGLEFDVLAAACADFSGVARRFEVRGDRGGVTVVDDYAHHPTELRALLEATRQAMPGRRVVAVFQPHLYSRTRDFAKDFASALLGAEVAIVLPIYPAREEPIEGVSSQLVVEEAERLGHPRVLAGPPIGEAVEQLEELLEPGDVLLTVGAGDVDDLAAAWLEGAA
ncbi:MAG: UDP-N-acetylmuramate--L-alanine ligase [Acidobacteria bacterium]|nr:UDP-N-acetylmuramate--L-alanine ligase [Candidatus Sulfomarinibacter kjeldsenii]